MKELKREEKQKAMNSEKIKQVKKLLLSDALAVHS